VTSGSMWKDGVAVVTGAASGIGSGLARKASHLGMKVVLVDMEEKKLQEVAATLAGDRLVVTVDVTSLKAMQDLAERVWSHFGRVDLLFNNAGIMTTGLMWQIEPADWQRVFEVNVNGVMNGIRAFVPRMIKAGIPSRIVNTSSTGGFLPSPLMAPYTATKAAVVALTESLLAELEMVKAPVKVSLLAPGPVKTGIFKDPFGAIVGPETSGFVELLRGLLEEHGLTPDEFAERVFDGIGKDLYWLMPQPEMIDEQLRSRTEMILQRQSPKSFLLG
jgi:NAD(P)-dependent dehydrogenase (short-subunit alcohol dehydrogenase family)